MKEVPPRLEQLLRRDLGARRALVREAADEPVEHQFSLSVRIDDGRDLVLIFDHAIADVAASTRRLEMLVDSFRDQLRESDPSRTRRAPEEVLHRELQVLANEASAFDVVVLDAQSPVVWGHARALDGLPQVVESVDNVVALPGVHLNLPTSAWLEQDLTRKAVESVRSLPQLALLPRGGTLLHHAERAQLHYVARSFATIYVVVLVFDGAYDELRAERTIVAHLPLIERAVLALPPLDPEPVGGAKAMRRS